MAFFVPTVLSFAFLFLQVGLKGKECHGEVNENSYLKPLDQENVLEKYPKNEITHQSRNPNRTLIFV